MDYECQISNILHFAWWKVSKLLNVKVSIVYYAKYGICFHWEGQILKNPHFASCKYRIVFVLNVSYQNFYILPHVKYGICLDKNENVSILHHAKRLEIFNYQVFYSLHHLKSRICLDYERQILKIPYSK